METLLVQRRRKKNRNVIPTLCRKRIRKLFRCLMSDENRRMRFSRKFRRVFLRFWRNSGPCQSYLRAALRGFKSNRSQRLQPRKNPDLTVGVNAAWSCPALISLRKTNQLGNIRSFSSTLETKIIVFNIDVFILKLSHSSNSSHPPVVRPLSNWIKCQSKQ